MAILGQQAFKGTFLTFKSWPNKIYFVQKYQCYQDETWIIEILKGA
jgi:hypothetical protein